MEPNGRQERSINPLSDGTAQYLRRNGVDRATRKRRINAKPRPYRRLRQRITREAPSSTQAEKISRMASGDRSMLPIGKTHADRVHRPRKRLDPSAVGNPIGLSPIANPLPLLYLRTTREPQRPPRRPDRTRLY